MSPEEIRQHAARINDPELNEIVASMDRALAGRDACNSLLVGLERLRDSIKPCSGGRSEYLESYLFVAAMSALLASGVTWLCMTL